MTIHVLNTKERSALTEHLREHNTKWLSEDFDSNADGDRSWYTTIDYDALVREIDEFTASFRLKDENDPVEVQERLLRPQGIAT